MSSWSYVTFESGDRPVEEVEAAVQSIAEDDRHVEVHGDDVVYYESAPLYGLEDVEPPCDRALSFWQNDTSMAGGGLLFERVDGRFVRTAEYADEDYGDETKNFFLVEYGIEGYQR